MCIAFGDKPPNRMASRGTPEAERSSPGSSGIRCPLPAPLSSGEPVLNGFWDKITLYPAYIQAATDCSVSYQFRLVVVLLSAKTLSHLFCYLCHILITYNPFFDTE